jgi:cyanophycinase
LNPSLLFLCALGLVGVIPMSRGQEAPLGHLLIHGGGPLTQDVLERFRDLGGGPAGHLVYVPTSMEDEPGADPVPRFLRSLGFGTVTVLHTRDRATADRAEFADPLRRATAVWFSGGRQWRTTDVYLGTRTAEAFHEVYRRGGILAGSSAGATVQGSFLVRGAPEGNHIMMAPGRVTGFGFLPGVAIDQHALVRDRLDDMIPVLQAHPELLGLSLDEGTALHVHRGVATVLGKSKVAVFDPRAWTPDSPRYLLLEAGQRYDLARRRLLFPPR